MSEKEKIKQEMQRLHTDVFLANREVEKWAREWDRVAAILLDRRARHAELIIKLEAIIDEYKAAKDEH